MKAPAQPTCPSCLIRIDDGERFVLNADWTYSMENSMMDRPYAYTYGALMSTKAFRHPTTAECARQPGAARPIPLNTCSDVNHRF